MALEVERSAAAISAAASWCGARIPFEISDGVDAVCDALSERSVGTHSEVIVESLSVALAEVAAGTVSEAETRFAALCGAEPQDLRDDLAQLRALRSAGWDVNSIPHRKLPRRSREPVVGALWALRDAVDADEAIRRGDVASLLTEIVDGVESTDNLDDTIARLVADGFDATRLAWSAITFETHNHIRLIWHQTNKMARNFPDRRAADLFAFGWMGLRVALKAYDPDRCAFSTYACTRIKGAIRDGVRAESPIPKRLTTYMRKVASVEDDLTQTLGRVPHLAEVAEQMGSELDQLRIIPRLAPAASIEEITWDGVRSEPPALVEHTDPADAAVNDARARAIEDAISLLGDDEAEMARLMLEGCTVAEARAATGATARQLRQRWARAREVLAYELVEWAPA